MARRRGPEEPEERQREERWRSWMVAAQAGDGPDYGRLLLEILPYVRRLVGRRISDPSAREDVVQNVFLSLHRARHTYRPERPFRPWLHAIARHAVIDHARSRGRRDRREISLESDGVPEPAGSVAVASASPLSPELELALASLPDKQREAVELIHVAGLTVEEAARRAGTTAGALKVRAHRGYRALRARLRR